MPDKASSRRLYAIEQEPRLQQLALYDYWISNLAALHKITDI
jgi:hypothetical protein